MKVESSGAAGAIPQLPAVPTQIVALEVAPAEVPNQSPPVNRFESSVDAIAVRTKLRNEPLAVKHEDKNGSSGATRSGGKQKIAASAFIGVNLGTNASNQSVVVKREVGSPEGYEDRLQATAVARMFRAEPAVVVQDSKGRWRAFETSAGFNAGPVANSGVANTSAIYGVPSSAGIAAARQKVDAIRARLSEIDALKKQGNSSKALAAEASQLATNLGKANLTMVALTLGVPEADINFIRTSTNRTPGKININADPSQRSGVHGPVLGQPERFDKDRVTAFEINAKVFKGDHAVGTMFHEVTHEKDSDLAQKWVKLYEQEKKQTFVAGHTAEFQKWMYAQALSKLSKADAELVVNEATDNSSTTEARANVRTFLLNIQSGRPDLAKDVLKTYANEIKRGGYANPAPGSYVQAELMQEMDAVYKQLPKDLQKDFQAAIAGARSANPNAWVAALRFK